jgi:multiple sugar transport system permease protein/putative aldouronate transport system permease protein
MIFSKLRDPVSDRVFYTITNILFVLLFIVFFYPLYYIIIASFSSADAVVAGRVFFWPVEINIDGYQAVFRNRDIVRGFFNSALYTIVGTLINVSCTMVAAYPLARRDLPFRRFIILLFTFTMFFSGGMIPDFILLRSLGMLDTIWAMVIPGAISVYNMIIARTFIENSIPGELMEAAKIDGCSDTRFFFQMVLPLSRAVIAVITLYYAIGHWNSYFSAFLYLSSRILLPLQIILREILIANTIDTNMMVDPQTLIMKQNLAQLLKFSLIVVSSAPVLCFYPLAQKHFLKGVMIGSVKG